MHNLPATRVHQLPLQGNCGTAPAMWAAAVPVSHPVPPTPASADDTSDTSHDDLLRLISQIHAMPESIGFRRDLTGDTQRSDYRLWRAMQAAKANTAEATPRLWSRLAHITPHLLLRMTLGKRLDEDAGSMRDEIRKRFTLAEKGEYEKLLKEAWQDQEQHKQLKTTPERVEPPEREENANRRAATAADRGQLRTAQRDKCTHYRVQSSHCSLVGFAQRPTHRRRRDAPQACHILGPESPSRASETSRWAIPTRNLPHGRRARSCVEDSPEDGEITRQSLHRLRNQDRIRSCQTCRRSQTMVPNAGNDLRQLAGWDNTGSANGMGKHAEWVPTHRG